MRPPKTRLEKILRLARIYKEDVSILRQMVEALQWEAADARHDATRAKDAFRHASQARIDLATDLGEAYGRMEAATILAQHLTRDGARDYFPEKIQKDFDLLISAIQNFTKPCEP